MASEEGGIDAIVIFNAAVWWPDQILVLGFVGENTGESRTLVVAGIVDGGAFGCRFLVGGIDVAILTRLP